MIRGPLPRISHTCPTAAAQSSALTALCSVGLLDVPQEHACGGFGRRPCQSGVCAASQRPGVRNAGLADFLFLALFSILASGCGGLVRTTTTVDVPPAYGEAKTATRSELVELINHRYAGIESLRVSRLKVEFEGGSAEQGYLEKYPRGNGHLLAQRPDRIYLNILNPLTSSTVAAIASAGETFKIWVPRENKFFTGRTDVHSEDENPFLNIRPLHILQSLLIEEVPVDSLRHGYFAIEDQDGQFKYYVLGIFLLEENSTSVQLVRKLWIERSEMKLVRQQYFGPTGEILTDIRYNRSVQLGSLLVNSGVEIRRPRERYSIRFDLEDEQIKVNQPLKEGVFELHQPEGAELVIVEGKTEGM